MIEKKIEKAKGLCTGAISVVGMKIAGLFKTWYVVGSLGIYFSGVALVAPISGALGSLASVSVMYSLLMVLTVAKTGLYLIPFTKLALIIPGYFAALYWTEVSSYIKAAIPVVCIIAWAMHPVGFSALPYACYWIIPIAVALTPNSSTLLRSLGSTLSAHAVGSVIWLYAQPMTASVWLALIPQVALERMVYAACITMVVVGVQKLQSLYQTGRSGAVCPA